MTIAEDKLQNNIIEYVLFVWQMEDLARAANFDASVYGAFVGEGKSEETVEAEIAWFKDLCLRMKNEGKVKSGHIEDIQQLVNDLQQLHFNLLRVVEDKQYQQVYVQIYPSLQEFQKHMAHAGATDVESLLTGLYGLLMLKLNGKPVSDSTQKAMDEFSQILGLLAAHYRRQKDGEPKISLN